MGGTRLTNIVQRRVIFYPERIRTGLFIIRKLYKKDFGSYYTIRIEYPESEKDFGDQYIKYYIKRFPEQI